MTLNRTYELPTGRITVEVDRHDHPGDVFDLFGVAARRNPKRGFVFVSTVLGRHVPVSPSRMAEVHASLASMIPADLPGPVLLVGMAETAVALGAGVARAYARIAGRDDCLYVPSTRHPITDEIAVRFSEDHSHATQHLIHLPDTHRKRSMFRGARSLVMVDDEMTTGRTFDNLQAAILPACPDISRIHRVVIKDWSGRPNDDVHSILSGRYRWEADPNAAPVPDPGVDVTARGLEPIVAPEWGRLGLDHDLWVAPPAPATGSVLVLGSGEYVWPAFLHALRLERESGSMVRFGATTRSPIFVGGAITSAFTFSDNYGLGIPNHLYNVEPGDYDRIDLFTETPAEAFDPAFVQRYAPNLVVPFPELAAA